MTNLQSTSGHQFRDKEASFQIINPLRDEYPSLPTANWISGYWRDWVLETDKTEDGLRLYVTAMISAIQNAGQRFDLPAIRRLMDVYDSGYRLCLQEPFLTAYEFGLMHIAVILADYHLISGNIKTCLEDIGAVEMCLREGDKRREIAGVNHRANSTLRLTCLGIRAACLSDPQAGREPTDTELIDLANRFWTISDSSMHKIDQVSPQSRLSIMQVMARWEIEICKLAYLTGQQTFDHSVDSFNRHYEADLSNQMKPLETLDQAQRTAWYWDLEVWKHLKADPVNTPALAACTSRREASMRISYGAFCTLALQKYWSRLAKAA